MNLSSLDNLESIEIGDDCFESVQTFKIDGLNRLKTIKIGSNSFTHNKNDIGNDKSKSFHILNCESLESIQIGEYSFSDFGGEFELKNLPQLQSITLGYDTFRYSLSTSFESIKHDRIKWFNVDLPNLTSIKSVGGSFYNTRSLTLESIYQYWILIIFRYSKSSRCQTEWFI